MRPNECASGRNRKAPPTRARSVNSCASDTFSRIESMFSWVWITPLGSPVVPEV
jgi:hypothetical protein